MTAAKLVTASVTSDAYSWTDSTGGGTWGTLADWSDTTTGLPVAATPPGTLTPVTIVGLVPATPTVNPAFERITGGGSAASIALTGNVSLAGSYKVAGALNVGSMVLLPFSTYEDLAPGSLALAKGGALTAATVSVVGGAFSLASGTTVSSTGAVSIGFAGGQDVPAAGGSYLYAADAGASIALASGSALSVGGGLSVGFGMLGDVGGTVAVTGMLTVGTTGTDPGSTSAPSVDQGISLVAVTKGGTLTVTGAIAEQAGLVVADGAGSKLVANGILTAATAGGYEGLAKSASGSEQNANVAALNGGVVQLGGLVLNAPASWSYLPISGGVSVDATSTIEIGSAGKPARGAITIDAGKTITADTTTSLSGNLVDNGTVSIAGGVLTETAAVSGSGVMQIGANATLLLDGSVAATDTIAFLSAARATLSIGTASTGRTAAAVAATITGYQIGDTIVLGQTSGAATATAASYTAATGLLVLSNGATTIETLHLAGSFTGKSFVVSPAAGGASISLVNLVAPVVSLAATPTATDAAHAMLGTAAAGAVCDALSVALVSDADFAAASKLVLTNGSLLYTPGTITAAMLGPDELTYTVTDTVTHAVTTETQTVTQAGYALPATAITIAASQGIATFSATNGVLTAADAITGAAGSANTLILSGGGQFNLELPKTLAGIQTVIATEGQAAAGGSKPVAGTGTSQVVHLRDGLNVTLNVASTNPSLTNTNPSGITIYGGADSSVINLGYGSDTVVLGSATEVVNASVIAGTVLVQATAAQAGALVTGTARAITTLEITTGGVATLNANTTHATVHLDLAGSLTLGKLGFITAFGTVAGNTITAAASNQALGGLAGGDTLVGYGGYGDTFQGLAAGLNGDTIKGFGGSDLIDFTNIAFATAKPLGFSASTDKLSVSDGTHSSTLTLTGSYTGASFAATSDGHGGTAIRWV